MAEFPIPSGEAPQSFPQGGRRAAPRRQSAPAAKYPRNPIDFPGFDCRYCTPRRVDGQTVLTGFLLRRALHDPDHAIDNIVDGGKIPLTVSVIENFYGFALQKLVSGAEICHIVPPGGAVDGEEPQTREGNIVELLVGVSHQIVALFCGGAEGHGVVHLVVGKVGH